MQRAPCALLALLLTSGPLALGCGGDGDDAHGEVGEVGPGGSSGAAGASGAGGKSGSGGSAAQGGKGGSGGGGASAGGGSAGKGSSGGASGSGGQGGGKGGSGGSGASGGNGGLGGAGASSGSSGSAGSGASGGSSGSGGGGSSGSGNGASSGSSGSAGADAAGGSGGAGGAGGAGGTAGGGGEGGASGSGGSGPPPPVAVALARYEALATDPQQYNVPQGAPGNPWGGQQSRVVRTGDGQVLAAYLTSPPGITDPSKAEWVLMRRGAGEGEGWSELGRRENGREPMHVLRAPDDQVFVFSWPGTPAYYTVSVGQQPQLTGPTPVPGGWQMLDGSATPYSGAGVSPSGDLCLVASRGVANTQPGAPYSSDSAWDFACRKAGGDWAPMTSLPIGLRYTYPYVVPSGNGSWSLIGNGDFTWVAAGLTKPQGAFDYVFDGADLWSFSSLGDAAPTRQTLGSVPLVEPPSGHEFYQAVDAMNDHLGRLHVLVRSTDSAGDSTLEHKLVGPGGEVKTAAIKPFGYTSGYIRLVQDDFGRFFVLFFADTNVYVYPTLDADGLELGERVDLTASIIADGRQIAGMPFVAEARGGTAPGRFVEVLFDMKVNGTPRVDYARIALY